MRLADFCALLIAGLLMLLVMTVLGVKLLPERVVNGSALFACPWLEGVKNTTCIQSFKFPHWGKYGEIVMRTKFANFPI